MFPRDLTVWKLTLSQLLVLLLRLSKIQHFERCFAGLSKALAFQGNFQVCSGGHIIAMWKIHENTTNWLSKPYLTNWFFQGRVVYHVLFLRMLLAILLLKAMNFVPAMLVHHKHFLLKVKLPKWPVVNTKVILRQFQGNPGEMWSNLPKYSWVGLCCRRLFQHTQRTGHQFLNSGEIC